jgi:hypothetical protein
MLAAPTARRASAAAARQAQPGPRPVLRIRAGPRRVGLADALELPQQAQFYKSAEKDLAAAAMESGRREQAAQDTKTMLTGMFGLLEIHAIFLDDDDAAG